MQKFKNLIRPIINPEDQLQKELPKEMEFGFKMIHGYNKHVEGLQIRNCIHNETIKGFVSFSEKQINVWTSDKFNQVETEGHTHFTTNFFDDTGSHSISCLTYSKAMFFYLVVSTDFKLHLFNDYLYYAGYFPLRTRLVNFIDTIDEGQ